MNRALVNSGLALTVVLLGGLGGGCGGDSAAITCEPNTFRLVGSIDDASIDVTQTLVGNGSFDEIDTPGVLMTVQPSSPPSSLTDLRAMWASYVGNGHDGPATATVKIPTSAFPDDVFCAGQGSTVSISGNMGDTFNLHLTSLASGTGCATARRGTLEACARFAQ